MTDYALLLALDRLPPATFTPWEQRFLTSLLRHGTGYRSTPERRVVLWQMAQTYLPASEYAGWVEHQTEGK